MGDFSKAREKKAATRTGRQTAHLNVTIYPRDREIMDRIVNYYGSSQSEVFRLMVRYFEIHLGLAKKE